MKRPNSHRAMSRDAEKYFPVRIRVARDRLGYERQYNDMRQWLDASIGPSRWWHVGERSPPLPDTILFYFVAVADAQAFVERFSCGVCVAGEWPYRHQAPPADEADDMRLVAKQHRT